VSVEFEVLHDGQFWIGVVAVTGSAGVRACKVVFGAEPTDPELYAFLLANGYDLLRRAEASPLVPSQQRVARVASPKRAARDAAAQARRIGKSTAAQEAVRKAQEAVGRDRDEDQRRSNDERAALRRTQRQAKAKAKAKHRGR
jgi:hypothetical protein